MKQKISLTLLLCYMLLVSYLSLSKPDSITDISQWDKLAHALAYIVFSMLSANASQHAKQFCYWLLTCFCFGIMIEFLQGLTAYREASFQDALANLSGLAAGTLVLLFIHQFKPLSAFRH